MSRKLFAANPSRIGRGNGPAKSDAVPTALAEAPNVMNTTENPHTSAIAFQ